MPVLAVGDSKVNAAAAALETGGVHARILKRLPTGFQQQSLLRIHGPRLNGENVEEPRVEQIQPVNETADAVHGCFGTGVSENPVPWTRVPTPVHNCGFSSFELAPESRQIGCTGETARHADDCYVIAIMLAALGFLPFQGRRLQGRGRGADPADFGCQMTRESSDVRKVEHYCIRSRILVVESAVQPVPQLHGHQGVHSHIEEADRR